MALEGGSAAGAIKAGAAFVSLFVDDKGLHAGLARAKAKLQSFGKNIALAGAAVGAAGAALTTPLLLAFKEFANFGDQLDEMSARTGVSVEALSQLKFAAEQSGSGIEELELGLRKMQLTIADAENGSAAAAGSLRALGLSAKDLLGLTGDEQLEMLAEGIQKTGESAMRTAASMDVLGRGGAKLIPLLSGGAKGIRELRDEANKRGLTVSTADASSAAVATDALNRLDKSFKALRFSLGAALAPLITEFIGQVLPLIKASIDWAKENRPLVASIFSLGVALVAGGTALTVFGGAVAGIGFALGAIGGLVGGVVSTLTTVVGLLATPPGAALAIWVGLGTAFFSLTDTGREMAGVIGGELSGAWDTLKETAVGAWGGIMSAIKAGDFAAAGQIAMAGLMVVFEEGKARLLTIWNTLTDPLIEPFLAVKGLLVELWDTASEVATGIKNAFVEVTAPLVTLWDGFTEYFKDAWGGTVKFFKDNFATILTVFAPGIALLVSAFKGLQYVFRNGFTEGILTIREAWTNFVAYIQQSFIRAISAVLAKAGEIANGLGATSLEERIGGIRDSLEVASAEIEQDRVTANFQRRKDLEASAKAAREARKESEEGAANAVTAAKQAFQNLLAQEAARPQPVKPGAKPLPDLEKQVKAVVTSAVKGGFSATLAAQALGRGDSIAQKQLDLQRDQLKATRRIEDAIREGGAAFG